MFFDSHDGEHLSAIKHLLGFSCGLCSSEAGNCRSLVQLRGHLMGKHKRMLCSVCVEAGRKYISEMPRFTKSQLERHNSRGDPAEGLRGHPLCNFCRPKRFFDDEALYHHMVDKHYQCDVCQAMGNGNRFSKIMLCWIVILGASISSANSLNVSKRFVVFRSEIDLQGHMASHHPNVRYNRKIAVNFTVGRA